MDLSNKLGHWLAVWAHFCILEATWGWGVPAMCAEGEMVIEAGCQK